MTETRRKNIDGWKRAGLCAVGLVLLGGIGFGMELDGAAAAMAGLDPLAVRLGLGIFACVAFLWLTEALPLAVTALLVPVLGCATGLLGVKGALASFADPLIFLFLGGFALAAALSAQGLDAWLARRLVAAGKGDFLRVSYLMFAATALLSMWVSNTATTAMMMPLVLGIVSGLPDGAARKRSAVFLLLGVAYAASVGGIGTVVGSPPNGIAAAALGIDFVDWMKFGVPTVLVLMPVLVMVLRLMCQPERARLAVPVETEGFAFTRARMVTLGIFLLTAAGWVFSVPLARALGVTGSFDTLVALAAIVALAATGVASWRQIEDGTDWGVLLLFGGGITLGVILGETRASLYMARVFAGWTDGWPMPLVVAAVVGFTIFLTELTSNTALAALMVPIFYTIAGELGAPPATLVLPLAIAASCSFMLPVGTPPNAIVFATGRVPQREMIRVGSVLNLVFVAVLAVLAQVIF